ncbi:MAG: polysaccharide deacetylase family protein [Acidobacteriota bacterium]
MHARSLFVVAALALPGVGFAQQTWAEKLGWDKGDRVVILHVDDAGMSHDSNAGTLRSMQQGSANSTSVMMPCPWVPEWMASVEDDPSLDVGVHLTLTSEFKNYCWGPLLGKDAVPGLVDGRGCMWRSVAEVVTNSNPTEVEAEVRAQVRKAREFGLEPTHLDSHMGTLFATPEFLDVYLRVGMDEQIPVMFPGGHNTYLRKQYEADGTPTDALELAVQLAQTVWDGGLPVLDDLHNTSYGWKPAAGEDASREEWHEMKVERYTEALRGLEPGVTMVIMHSTDVSPNFEYVSGSGPTRQGDTDAMADPRIAQVIEEEGILLTTWRELMARRRAIGSLSR